MTMYCVSDLHGQLNLWRKIQKILKPEDKLFCLGDCIDRGPDGIIILTEMLEDPRVTLLMGNHEDFLARYTIPLLEKTEEEYMNMIIHPWISWNGGLETFDYMKKHMTEEEILQLVNKVKELPKRVDVIDGEDTIILTHAGCDPWLSEKEAIAKANRFGKSEGHPYIWDRGHIWDEPFPEGYENVYVIHGHTGVIFKKYFPNYPIKIETSKDFHKIEIYKYCDGHKIALDLTSFYTHRAALFNLETFEAIYVEDENFFNNLE